MQKNLPLPQYEFKASGPSHIPAFAANVRISLGAGPEDAIVIPAASTQSKKTDAKAAAAFAALKVLEERGWAPSADSGKSWPVSGPSALVGAIGTPIAHPLSTGGQDRYVHLPTGSQDRYAHLPTSQDRSTLPPSGDRYSLLPAAGSGARATPQPFAATTTGAPAAVAARAQPKLEDMSRVVLIDLSDSIAAVRPSYAPSESDFVVAFSSSHEEPAAIVAMSALLVRAPGAPPGSAEAMLVAWIYKFIERYGAALQSRHGYQGLPIIIVSPAGASMASSGSVPRSILPVSISVLQNDVDYGDLGLRLAIVPDTTCIPSGQTAPRH